MPTALPPPDQFGPSGADSSRIAAHIVLRLLLARTIGIDGAAAPFATAPAGKPVLAGGGAPFFSLSHSGERALIGLDIHGEIGVDIEAPRSLRLPLRRRQQIVAAGIDMAAGQPLPGMTLDQQTLQAWVRLEAVAKCSGEGMGRLLARLGIFGGHTSEAATPADPSVLVRDIPLDRGYAAALAGGAGRWSGELQVFPVELDIIARFV